MRKILHATLRVITVTAFAIITVELCLLAIFASFTLINHFGG